MLQAQPPYAFPGAAGEYHVGASQALSICSSMAQHCIAKMHKTFIMWQRN